MTNHHHGSSLLQARHAHLHRHSETLPQQHQQQPEQHQQDQLVDDHPEKQPDDLRHRSPDKDSNHPVRSHEAPVVRQVVDLESADIVTEVVETVSVVHIVDSNGSLIHIQTGYTPRPPVAPVTEQVGTLTKVLEPTHHIPLPLPIPTQRNGDETSSPLPPGEAAPPTSLPTPEPTAEPTSQTPESLTSTPLTTASIPPGVAALNSTYTSQQKNTTAPYGNFTVAVATATLSESSISLIDDPTTTTAVLTEVPIATTPIGGPLASGTVAAAPPPAGAPAPPVPSTGPPTSTVVGSVVGSIAGVAIILVAALFLLRWRRNRQHNGHHMLSEPFEGAATRGLAFRGGNGGGNGNGAGNSAMAERGLPFANPSTLAALTGVKRSSQKGQQPPPPSSPSRSRGFHQPPPPSPGAESTGERGFYRVSGRKLPSVLQHGGDGYTDPRESHLSGGGSSVYSDASRDYLSSIGGIGTGGKPPPQRFALGSPMRPDSGFPVVMQPGAVRTPVVERGPAMVFAPTAGPGTSSSNSNRSRDDLAPPGLRDPIGRSHASQDGSRGSGSRFTEAI